MWRRVPPAALSFRALRRARSCAGPRGLRNSNGSRCPPGTQRGYASSVTSKGDDTDTKTYTVPGVHCGRCAAAIREEVSGVEGVEAVDVDLDAKIVTIRGEVLSDEALREALEEAGYEAA